MLVENSQKPIRVAVVGARGYSGLELTRLLFQHPQVKVSGLFASSAFDPADAWPEPEAKSLEGQAVANLISSSEKFDLAFLALPHEASAELAPQLLERGVDVIDLSGAFRLQEGSPEDQRQAYSSWYKMNHPCLNWLAQAQYGLVPFAQPKKAAGRPALVANPGCFATSVAMALIPLLKAGLLDSGPIIIDAKSGTTGAGKKAEERLLFSEVADNCLPYRVGHHQHEPEIQLALKRWGKTRIEMSFTPNLLPVRRGIISSIYSGLRSGVGSKEIASAYHECFARYPYVKFADYETAEGQRELKLTRVVGSPRTHLVWKVKENRLTLFSLIDNLLKGAASQAVENMNSLYGFSDGAGLAHKEGLL